MLTNQHPNSGSSVSDLCIILVSTFCLTSYGITVSQVRKPKLGEKKPSLVQAEIVVDLSAFTGIVREEWEQIRKHDVVFVLCMAGSEYYTPASMMVGDGVEMMDDDAAHDDSGAWAAKISHP